MPIEYWNPTPIYYEDFDLNSLSFINEIKKIEDHIEKLYTPNSWNDNVFSTLLRCNNILGRFKLHGFNSFLTSQLLKYFEEINFFPSKFNMLESWFNKTYKHGFQDYHEHGSNIVSGVFYYDIENNSFEEGIEFRIKSFLNVENPTDNYKNFVYHFKPGRIILFPGCVEHRVRYKKTDGVRKSFSFNFAYE